MGHGTFSGVFNRNHSVVGDASLDMIEDVSKARLWNEFDTVAEFTKRGLMST